MSKTETRPHNTHLQPIIAAVVALLLAFWFVTQNDLAPQQPVAFITVFRILGGSIPVLAALWIGSLGYGYALRSLLLRKPGYYLIEELALGIAGLLLINWFVAWAGLLSRNGAVAVFGIGALLNLLKLLPDKSNRQGERTNRIWPWSVVLLTPGIAMLFIAACCPPGTMWRVEAFGYDVTSYHLQLPREWLAAGQMTGLEHNVYSYLPSLIEGGYLLIGVLSGSVLAGVYTCQLFHVSLALLAAAAIGKTVAMRSNTTAGIGAAAIFLATPWVLITGSMAYNEMGTMAFGAAALLILFSEHGKTRSGAAAIGLLVGTATLCKLTAGVMIAAPIGLMLLFGSLSASRLSKNLQFAAIATLVGLLTLTPFLLRNYTETGNPVFPFAAHTLGAGHWNEELIGRWDTAHGLSAKHEGKLVGLGRQWLFNTGYGAVGGHSTPRETRNIARFDREGGVPVLWIAVLASGVLILMNRDTRRAGVMLGFMMLFQVGFWMFLTHMQSRFLLPTLLPACLLIGFGFDRLRALAQSKAPTIAPVIGSAMVIVLLAMSYVSLVAQTPTTPDPATGEPLQTPIWMAIGVPMDNAEHPINRLPASSKVLMIADNSGLFYLHRPIVYASAFDEAPLGKVIRQAGGDPGEINALLRARGITHVWVHWSELDRLHSTYGHDGDVTRQTLARLSGSGWKTIETVGQAATLYALPKTEH